MTLRTRRTGGIVLGMSALLLVGYLFGQTSAPAPLAAQQAKNGGLTPVAATGFVEDNPKRVVAYVHNNIPITREEFGDYLISLYVDERLELYVNKRIIEIECAKKGIDVTPIEIDAAIEDDCKKINVSRADFVNNVLKTRYRKSLEEWRYDVIKPRLLLARLCRDQITVDETELKHMYENRYGEKAKVKIILWPPNQHDIATKMYAELRKPGTEGNPDAAWDAVATRQPDATLASSAGSILPIGRFSGSESARVEEIAFGLKVGDISPIIDIPRIGFLVVKRTGTVEAVKNVDFAKVRPELQKEVIDRKLDKEIPIFFSKLSAEAKPMLLIGKPKQNIKQVPELLEQK